MKPVVRLIVIGDSGAVACEAGCGVDWSRPETITQARQALKARFGERVQIVYAAGKPGRLGKGTPYPYPRLTVDGEIRLAGQFDLRQIIDIAETQLEMAVTE